MPAVAVMPVVFKMSKMMFAGKFIGRSGHIGFR